METKKISLEEMRDYILAQPDDRPVDMLMNNNRKDQCGCVMIEYARDHDIPCSSVGTRTFFRIGAESDAELDFQMRDLIEGAFNARPKNFGELKQLLKS